MDNNKLKINLTIGEHNFPLTIEREEEVYYRKAGKYINAKLKKYKDRFGLPDLELSYMVLIDLALKYFRLEEQKNDTHFINEIIELTNEIDEYLENL